LNQGKSLTIDERAYFAINLPDPQENFLPTAMANFLERPDSAYVDPNMIRFYGLLSPEQKAQMLNGGLPMSALTDREAEYLDRMVFGANGYLQYAPPRDGSGRSNYRAEDFQLHSNGILREATEALPDGIPRQGLLSLRTNNSHVVISSEEGDSSPAGGGRIMAANELAWQKYSQEHPELFPWVLQQGQKINLSSFQYGQRLQMTFTFAFTTSLSLVQSLEDKNLDDFTKVTLDDLPSDFKKQFDDAYENFKKSYANVTPGQLGRPTQGANPPPR